MNIENEIVERDTWYDVYENMRMYYFTGGGIYAVPNTRQVKVSDRGTHYVRDFNGVLHIINNTWIAIEVNA